MNLNDSDRILARLGAAWTPLEPSTRAVWREHLAELDYQIALEAEKLLETSNPRRPSLAEFRAAYRMEADRHRPSALVSPSDVDPAGVRRLHEMMAEIPRHRLIISEKILDELEVPNWRKRILDAVAEDEEHGTHRKSFDEVMDHIRAEVGTRVSPQPEFDSRKKKLA